MKNYDNMKMYRSAFSLMLYIEEEVAKFPRYHKYSIGSEIRKMIFEIVTMLAGFNENQCDKKVEIMKQILKEIEKLKIKLALSREIKAFKSYNTWFHAAEMLYEISAQGEKLKKYFEKKKPESKRKL
ncbi:MAG TPA: four helix bundle protein [bacterium]|jgi:hypothetical protein|nr:four helix bundle protein [bacterium]HQM83486.1 four helix bundle protein [bacterium]